MQVQGWVMREVNAPLDATTFEAEVLAPDEVLVEIAGCGVCHTDLGYLFDGVPLRSNLPRILGHEIAGTVVQAGADVAQWQGRAVVVPAVIPCGQCKDCNEGYAGICKQQIFPGNDIHGGFASHVRVPARGLAQVPQASQGSLAQLAVVADAVTTPLNAVVRSEIGAGDVAIFVGVGGVGAFGVQIAKARGAHTIAIDIDDDRLSLVGRHGADLTFNSSELSGREIKKKLRSLARDKDWPQNRWTIFETSGTAAGQELAFSLLVHGATLMVVGYTAEKVALRLSNLMAFEARALGVWGCPPDLYGEALELVTTGKVNIAPFVQQRPMSQINEVLGDLHNKRIHQRIILTPDFK